MLETEQNKDISKENMRENICKSRQNQFLKSALVQAISYPVLPLQF